MRSPSSFTNSVAVLRTARMDGHAVRLHSLRGHALDVAPIRVGLGALWLAVALGLTVLGAVAVTFRVDPNLWWDRAGGVNRRTA